MADHLPLLAFPRAQTIPPPKGGGGGGNNLHSPGHARQVERLEEQIANLENDFNQYKGSVSGALVGLEPETVLVIEIAGSVENFKQAVDATAGLEWLAEWGIEDIEPVEGFYNLVTIGVNFFVNATIPDKETSKEIRSLLRQQGYIDDNGTLLKDDLSNLRLPQNLTALKRNIKETIDKRKQKPLSGKLFVSMVNQRGMDELLVLWQQWKNEKELPRGKTKWRDLFAQTLQIRRWGIQETLYESGMIDRWKNLLDPMDPTEEIHFQIELFYRQNKNKREENETAIKALLAEANGNILSPFIDMPGIAFHAVKAMIPAAQIRQLLSELDTNNGNSDIQLFRFPNVMYFYPTGQSISSMEQGIGTAKEFPEGSPELPPVVAILDGAPNLQHAALKDRVLFDDPDNLSSLYQPGERKHGTTMASLVIHGDWNDEYTIPLNSQIYFIPVMQPNPESMPDTKFKEHFPDDIFFEDRIERAVRRMFEGEGNTPPQAETVKIINISMGDPERPFIHTLSPWARLLDSLSWKYKVLFCVSAGNCVDSIDIGMPSKQFNELSDEEKVGLTLEKIGQQLPQRRLISPAEALNVLTVGALHTDASTNIRLGHRIDILPNQKLFSPISRFGYGFRRSVKPEILFPGGQQLYKKPPLDNDQQFFIDEAVSAPGLCVAWDEVQEGDLSKVAHTRGTSNATALATRSGARIYEVLAALQAESNESIKDGLVAVLIKALLVHGARHSEDAKKVLTDALKNDDNSRRIKEVVTRYLGYGEVDIERVLACTEQRVTVLGSGEISNNQVHEYKFPLPAALSGYKEWRRMVITLAWFTPINTSHRNLREAKLVFQPGKKGDPLPLKLERRDTDHNQVARGTVQHEVLEGKREISAYQDGEYLLLHVACKADATESLEVAIPYGLSVTLEVAEGVGIPIYQQVRARIRPQVKVV